MIPRENWSIYFPVRSYINITFFFDIALLQEKCDEYYIFSIPYIFVDLDNL